MRHCLSAFVVGALCCASAYGGSVTRIDFTVSGGNWYRYEPPYGMGVGTYRGSVTLVQGIPRGEDDEEEEGHAVQLSFTTGSKVWHLGPQSESFSRVEPGRWLVEIDNWSGGGGYVERDYLELAWRSGVGGGMSVRKAVRTFGGSERYYDIDCYDCVSATTKQWGFHDVVRKSVSVSINDTGPGKKGMYAYFQPKLEVSPGEVIGLSLDDAALLGGYDHFNWLNLVTYDPEASLDPGLKDQKGRSPNPTYSDPPPGGYQYLVDLFRRPFPVRDNLRWYLDEEFSRDGHLAAPGSGYVTELASRLTDNDLDEHVDELEFFDNPCSRQEVHFLTMLAGVRADGTGKVIPSTAFRWGSKPVAEGCEVFSRGAVDIDRDLVDYEFFGFTGIQHWPEGVTGLLDSLGIGIDDAGAASISEPDAMGLLIASLFAAAALGGGNRSRARGDARCAPEPRHRCG